jgi:hypothetical protein
VRKSLTWLGIALLVVVATLAVLLRLPRLIGIGPGYTAQITCGCIFVGGRTAESCAGDLDPLALKLVSVSISFSERTVTAKSLGLVRRTARYREGYGCSIDD